MIKREYALKQPRDANNKFASIPFEERFWPKVDKTESCWLWTANIRNGYGMSQSRDNTVRMAHRLAYEELVGEIPKGKELDHLCHTWDKSCLGGYECPHRRCVNPDHLEPVTHLVNGRRGRAGVVSAARQRAKTHCKFGHPFDEKNTKYTSAGARVCRRCDADRHNKIRWDKEKLIKNDIRKDVA